MSDSWISSTVNDCRKIGKAAWPRIMFGVDSWRSVISPGSTRDCDTVCGKKVR